MKILLLTDRLDAGGVETHVAELARGLRGLGCEVSILCEGGRLAQLLADEGIDLLYAPIATKSPFRLLRLRRELRRLVEREGFDVLHAHTRKTAFLLRKLPKSVARIVTVHARFRIGALLRRICFWGEWTIAVSEDLRAYVCDGYGVPAERVRVIPNGIDCARFVPPSERGGAPRILFASRLDFDCSLGASLLCELAPALLRRFPGIRIEIAGGGDAYREVYARADAVNRRLGRVVITTLGWVEDMPARLAECDIFVGVSRAAMEAAATGAAVILCGDEGYGGILSRESARAAALSNLCARGQEAASIDALTRDLTALIESPSLRKRVGEEGRALILRDYRTERMCRETLAVYHRARRVPTQMTLSVGGYFGCGNVGDDAILQGFLEGMHSHAPEVGVCALTGDPRRDRARFGVDCVGRKNPFSVSLAMLTSRTFLCGGGSLLQSVTGPRSLSYYLCLLRLGRFFGCRTALYAAGIGPFSRTRDQKRMLDVLGKCDLIGLRDRRSYDTLTELGLDRALLRVSADPACLLPLPPVTRADAILAQNGVPEGEYLAVVLHGSAPPTLRETVLTAVRLVCERHGLIPLLPIFDRRCDKDCTRRAAIRLGGHAIEGREASDAVALIGVSRAVVTLRLHALIFATCTQIPAVGIAADPRDEKIAAFAAASGQDVLPPDGVTVPALVEVIESARSSAPRRAPILERVSADMRRAAREELQRILDLSKKE